MTFLKRVRPFLITGSILFVVFIGLILLAPTSLIVALTPVQTTPVPFSGQRDIQIGRTDLLFHVGSQIEGEVSVQQFVHFYFRENTAASNFNQNFGRIPDWFPDDTTAYRVDLPNRDFPEQLFCQEQSPNRLLCDYRARIGRWTVHTDFVSRNTAVYDQAWFVEMVGGDG